MDSGGDNFTLDDPFFKIGKTDEPKLLAIEEQKDWVNIKSKQDYDAVNRQAWKKRKAEEQLTKGQPYKRFKGSSYLAK